MATEPHDRRVRQRRAVRAIDDSEPYARALRLRTSVRERYGDDELVLEAMEELLLSIEELRVRDEQLREQSGLLLDSATQLEHERARYQQLFDRAPVAYLVVDRNGEVRNSNRAARELIGDDLTRGPLADLVVKDDQDAFHRFIRRSAPDRTSIRLSFRSGGGPVRMQLDCAALDGDLLLLLRDVTEAEQVHEQLREVAEQDRVLADHLRDLDEIRSAFLLTVSHDLRTPMAAIAGLAGLLDDHAGELSDEDMRRVTRRIRQSAEWVIQQFADLLDLQRLDSGHLGLRREAVDVRSVLQRVVERMDLGRESITVDAEPVLSRIDPSLLERIVENLLRNSLRHTPRGTNIWIRCRHHRDGVLVVVEDDGPGIPSDLAPRLFELFQRERRPGGAEGLGVGLYLVRRFAELHGGTARHERRPGGGASFHVVLPDGD